MKERVVKISNWPFKKGIKAQLIWIGEPFQQDKKWMIKVYFRAENVTKEVTLDWATIHSLSLNKLYQDGKLNRPENPLGSKQVELNFTGIKARYNEKPWTILGTNIKTKSKTFSFKANNNFYIVPIIEVIRAVLAPDRFMLNNIMNLDNWENYFTYEIVNLDLNIDFTSEYDKQLLAEDYRIIHLAWILGNSELIKMIRDISNSVSFLGGQFLKYDFLLSDLKIRARIEEKGNSVLIQEIIAVREKAINVNNINYYHPSLEKTTEDSSKSKIREFFNIKTSGDRELTTDADGATAESEMLQTNAIRHDYLKLPSINKVTTGRTIKRAGRDEKTKKIFSTDTGLRTTGDVGGEDVLKGLEFNNISDVNVKGELEEFLEMLKILRRRPSIESIEVIIDYLPKVKGYRFARLNDNSTRRRYAIAKIRMNNGLIHSLIEVEREDKSLSMLLLKSDNNKIDWNRIYNELLIGLVTESGKWSKAVSEKIQQKGIVIIRNRHLRNSFTERAKKIYDRLLY